MTTKCHIINGGKVYAGSKIFPTPTGHFVATEVGSVDIPNDHIFSTKKDATAALKRWKQIDKMLDAREDARAKAAAEKAKKKPRAIAAESTEGAA